MARTNWSRWPILYVTSFLSQNFINKIVKEWSIDVRHVKIFPVPKLLGRLIKCQLIDWPIDRDFIFHSSHTFKIRVICTKSMLVSSFWKKLLTYYWPSFCSFQTLWERFFEISPPVIPFSCNLHILVSMFSVTKQKSLMQLHVHASNWPVIQSFKLVCDHRLCLEGLHVTSHEYSHKLPILPPGTECPNEDF